MKQAVPENELLWMRGMLYSGLRASDCGLVFRSRGGADHRPWQASDAHRIAARGERTPALFRFLGFEFRVRVGD